MSCIHLKQISKSFYLVDQCGTLYKKIKVYFIFSQNRNVGIFFICFIYFHIKLKQKSLKVVLYIHQKNFVHGY